MSLYTETFKLFCPQYGELSSTDCVQARVEYGKLYSLHLPVGVCQGAE